MVCSYPLQEFDIATGERHHQQNGTYGDNGEESYKWFERQSWLSKM